MNPQDESKDPNDMSGMPPAAGPGMPSQPPVGGQDQDMPQQTPPADDQQGGGMPQAPTPGQDGGMTPPAPAEGEEGQDDQQQNQGM